MDTLASIGTGAALAALCLAAWAASFLVAPVTTWGI